MQNFVDRRQDERRKVQLPFEGEERRVGERRSGQDRRKQERRNTVADE